MGMNRKINIISINDIDRIHFDSFDDLLYICIWGFCMRKKYAAVSRLIFVCSNIKQIFR